VKIVVMFPVGIGDALMFSPALHLLRERYPDARIDAVSMLKGAVEICQSNPDWSHLYWWDFMHQPMRASLGFIRKLRGIAYDVSINAYPQNRWQYNFVTRLIGAPVRLGHDYNHVNFVHANFLKTHRVREVDTRHNVEENVELVKLLGVPSGPVPDLQLSLSDVARSTADEWWEKQSFPPGAPVIGFHAGCATLKNHVQRRWPPRHFASLGRSLVEQMRARVLIFGGPEEAELKQEIAEGIGREAIQVSTSSLLDSVAILRRCDCLVTNDSVFVHLGAAVGQRIVAIFGPTYDLQVHPWHAPHRIAALPIPCRPCFHHSSRPLTCALKDRPFACVRELEPSAVLPMVLDLLQEELPPRCLPISPVCDSC
jgi:heptosyltransferase-2